MPRFLRIVSLYATCYLLLAPIKAAVPLTTATSNMERPEDTESGNAEASDNHANQQASAAPVARDSNPNRNSTERPNSDSCNSDKPKQDSYDGSAFATTLVAIAVAFVTLLGATVTLFSARSNHGEKVGRLRVSSYTIDPTSSRVTFFIENVGPMSLFALQVGGAARLTQAPFDIEPCVIEMLRPNERRFLIHSLLASDANASLLRPAFRAPAALAVKVAYVDHAGRGCTDVRVVKFGAGNIATLIQVRSRLRRWSFG